MSVERYWLEKRFEYNVLGLLMTLFFAGVFAWLSFSAWRDAQAGTQVAALSTFALISFGIAILFLGRIRALRRRLHALGD